MKPLTQKLQQEYDEDDFSQEEPKYWGSEAAGCIFIAKNTGRILLAKRSGEDDPELGVMEPGTWGTWGGKLDWGEKPKDAVVREVDEEVGYEGEYKLAFLWTYKDSEEGFEYHNFLVLVPYEFTPKLNWENETSKWVEFGQWPHPMHFGLKALLEKAGYKIERVVKLIKKKSAELLECFETPPAPRLRIKHKNQTPKMALREALESNNPYSSAIIKKGIVGDGVYEYEMNSPFSRILYRYEPSARLFYLDNISTPRLDDQGRGYAKALLESFFRLIKQYGGALDCDTYTTSGMTKIKPVVEFLSRKYGIAIVCRKGSYVTESVHDEGVVIGAIDFSGRNMDPIYSPNTFQRHPSNMIASKKRWRYYPEIEQLDWFGKPETEEHEKTVLLLKQMGYKVERVNHLSLLENTLLMEARATPKQLVEFLRAQIKGTEWDGKVFAVGGFVRDLLLGKEPKDLDIVIGVNQGGLLFTKWLGQKLGIYKENSNPVVFPTFGTANLRLEGVVWNGIDFSGENIDAVMFRKEQYHDPNSRKPVVQFTPHIEVDAQRRDITFNALYLDIASGEILDPTGLGKDDLKNGIVRTAIDPTIIYTDDALRMFRAVRFAAQLGFKLDPSIIDGIKKNLHRLGNTSRERVRDELNKILTSKHADYGLRLLRDTGLLPHVGAEFQQMVGMTQNVHHKDDVFDHTLAVIMGTQPETLNRLIALFHDIGKVATRAVTPKGVQFIGHEDVGPDIVERIMMSLKYPRAMIDAVKLGVSHHMKLKHGGPDAVKLTDKTLRKFKIALGNYLEHLLDVMHADNISHADASAMPKQIEAVRQRLKTLDIQVTKPVLPINGNDLLAMGVKAGPMVGKILSAVTEKWYENPNVSKEEAMHIAKSILNGSS